MKRIILINLICILSLFCLNQQAFCLPWPPDIDVYQIKFNYQSGYSYDGLKIKNISAPEWANGGSTNKKTAYIKNQSSRKIKAKFWFDRSGISWIKVYANKIFGNGGIGNIQTQQVDFNGSQYSQEELLSCNGTLPSSVGKRYFTWTWYTSDISGYELEEDVHMGYTGSHWHYTVLAAQQSPMGEPWVDVLEYACSWAWGQSSSSGAITKVVQNLYNNYGFLYDTYSGSPRYTNYGSGSFNLTQFLSEMGSGRVVNCYDMGKTVKIFANAIGCNAIYKYSNPFGYLNCIKPIGRGWANNPFYSSQSWPYNQPIVGEDDSGRTKFGNHAFGAIGSNIYDACLKVDTDGNPDYGPPFNESWATGWSWNTYKSKVIDNVPSSSPGNPTTYSFSVN